MLKHGTHDIVLCVGTDNELALHSGNLLAFNAEVRLGVLLATQGVFSSALQQL